jgi:hypothetical protein
MIVSVFSVIGGFLSCSRQIAVPEVDCQSDMMLASIAVVEVASGDREAVLGIWTYLEITAHSASYHLFSKADETCLVYPPVACRHSPVKFAADIVEESKQARRNFGAAFRRLRRAI